jgi:septal ring factor EnvC (AmiA/AmiB activator)
MRIPAAIASLCRDGHLERVRGRAGEVILAELRHSRARFPDRFHSLAEAVSVLEEELDELTDAVRASMTEHARAEAKQVAAMALRLIVDLEDRASSEARDRLAVQAAVSQAAHSQPPEPLISAHEGRGFIRGRHEQLCMAMASESVEPEEQMRRVVKAAYAIAVLALRFVAEVPADTHSRELVYRR